MAKTIEQIQAMITNKAEVREVINEVADYLEANPSGGGGGSSYLVYKAKLSQLASNPTVDIILDNTLTGGAISWVRDDAGQYIGTSAGSFPTESKVSFSGICFDNADYIGTLKWIDQDRILLGTAFASSGDGTDGALNLTTIEIQVYP